MVVCSAPPSAVSTTIHCEDGLSYLENRVQNLLRGTLEELHVDYPNSALNLGLGGARGPKPGERVLDATLVRATDKATVTLSHLTRGEAWTLLLFGGLHPAPEDAQARAALASETAERFGARVSIFGVDAAAKAPAEFPGVCLLDMLRHAHERYGVADAAFYLLRPDTYVSARGSMRHAPKLIAHLESLFT